MMDTVRTVSNIYVDATSILVFVFVFLTVYFAVRKPKGIPPGPALTLPLFGDLPLLAGGDVLKTFRKLRKKYGDVFSFYMGKELMIIINGYEHIYKAAVLRGHLFSARPENYMTNVDSGSARGKGIIFSSGTFWKSQRRFVYSHLQNLGFGKSSFEEKIMQEVNAYVSALNDTGGKPYDIAALTQVSVANVVYSIVCGKRSEYDDPVFLTILKNTDEESKRLLRQSVVMNCFPFLFYLPGDPLRVKSRSKNVAYFRKFVADLYSEHMTTYDSETTRDIMDAYIHEIKKAEISKEASDFTYEQLSKVVGDLVGAGSETTASTIRWAVLILINFPDIQLRLQADIDGVITNERQPSLDDKKDLPYVEAFIMETLRFANVAPLAVPHATMEDHVTFEGYFIPKNTSVIFNLDSAFFDPDAFEDSETFNPERFLDDNGNVLKPREFLPFGLGRRVCLGEAVARMELFLFLTAIIKEFDFLPVDENVVPKVEGSLGITYSPHPFEVRVVRRARTKYIDSRNEI